MGGGQWKWLIRWGIEFEIVVIEVLVEEAGFLGRGDKWLRRWEIGG